MVLVYIDDLTSGMVIEEDLLTPKGNFFLAAGSPLRDEHLREVRSWGVVEINISEMSLSDTFFQQQEQREQFIDKAEGFLYRRFILSDLNLEPVAAILRLFSLRYAGRMQRGWEPTRCLASMVSPEADPTLPVPSVPQLLKDEVELCSLPRIHNKVIESLNDMGKSTVEIAEMIGLDASIVIRLFGLINSAAYELPERVNSVSKAVSLIGLDELEALAGESKLIKTFAALPPEMINMDSFWRHSLRCGLIARALAEKLGLSNPEIYFTGGMLHDIGRLVLLDKMSLHYGRAVIKALDEHLPLYRAEQEVLMTDHCILGKLLALRWRLPAELTRMIGGHHSPGSARFAPEACVAHLADFLAHAMDQDVNLFDAIPPFQIKAWEVLNMKEEYLDPVIRQADGGYRRIIQSVYGDG